MSIELVSNDSSKIYKQAGGGYRQRTRAVRPVLATVTAVLVVCAPVGAQQETLNEILNQIASPDLSVRAPAAVKLISSPAMLNTRPGIEALVELLERENAAIEASFRRGVGVSREYGEEFGDYYAEVLGAVFGHGDRSDERTLSALAKGSYNPDSDFARDLARVGGSRLVATAQNLFASDLLPYRANGLAIIGFLYEDREEHGITSSAGSSMKAVIVQATEQGTLRAQAVQILGRVGNRSDLPLLRRIAAEEQDSGRGNLPSIAALANASIKAIQLRDPGKP